MMITMTMHMKFKSNMPQTLVFYLEVGDILFGNIFKENITGGEIM